MRPVCTITGAGGYVGSILSSALAAEFDVVPLSSRSVLGSIPWRLESTEDISAALAARNVAILVHAAWDFSQTSPRQMSRVNVEGSLRLIEAARRAGVQRIVFLSTISAFAGARSHYGRAKLEVEKATLAAGGSVIRSGLVWGPTPGGMFGSLRKQVASAKLIPLIGNGRAPQFLVHENDLAAAVVRAAQSDASIPQLMTVAHPHPWPFRDLLKTIARAQGREVTLLPVPWPLLFVGLRAAELLGLRVPFRSDSVISFVFQDSAPDFTASAQSGLSLRPFTAATN